MDNYSDGVTFVSKAYVSILLHICSLFMIVDCWHYISQDNIKFYHYVRMLTPYDLRLVPRLLTTMLLFTGRNISYQVPLSNGVTSNLFFILSDDRF